MPAAATAPCGGDFGTWLEGLKEEATAQGVSQSTIQSKGGSHKTSATAVSAWPILRHDPNTTANYLRPSTSI